MHALLFDYCFIRLFRFFNTMLLHEKDSMDEDDIQEDMQAKISADCYRNRAGQLRILSFCPSVFYNQISISLPWSRSVEVVERWTFHY